MPIFDCFVLNSCVLLRPKKLFFNKKTNLSARGGIEEIFFNKKNEPQCKRGVVIDIVKYYYVSDNFYLTCLLLLLFLEDVIKLRLNLVTIY